MKRGTRALQVLDAGKTKLCPALEMLNYRLGKGFSKEWIPFGETKGMKGENLRNIRRATIENLKDMFEGDDVEMYEWWVTAGMGTTGTPYNLLTKEKVINIGNVANSVRIQTGDKSERFMIRKNDTYRFGVVMTEDPIGFWACTFVFSSNRKKSKPFSKWAEY